MKNIILIMIASLVLFASCEDVEPDFFVTDEVHVDLALSWGDGCPRYEVRIDNPKKHKIDKVGFSMTYQNDEQTNVELTAKDGKYVYDVKDLPYAFAGDGIAVYAYVTVDGLNLGSREYYMTVPTSSDMEVTSAKFVYDDPSLDRTNRGTVYIYGQFSPWHIYNMRGSNISLPTDRAKYGYYSDHIVIKDCYPDIYGTANIILQQYKKDLVIDVDIPGELSINGMDRTSVKVGDYLTLRASGLRKDCTYEVEGMDIENIGRGSITCKPYTSGKRKVCLIEKHESFVMRVYSKDEVDVHY